MLLLPLVYSDGQGPGSHWSAHIADSEALELESLLLLICSLQGLRGLAIPWEPLSHATLVQTPVDAQDCRDCEKSTWLSCHAGGSIGRYFFWRYCTFFNHQIFPDSGPKLRKCFPPRIWCAATAKQQWNCCHFFLLKAFRTNSRGHSQRSRNSFSWIWNKSPAKALARNSQPSLF